MKVLVLCNRVPYPPSDGGAIAMYNGLKSIKMNADVLALFALNTKKHYQSAQQIQNAFHDLAEVYTADIDTSIRIKDALLNFFGKSSYNVDRFYSKSAEEKLIQILQSQSFDVVQFETLFVCPYIDTVRKYSNAKLVYRAHNVESQIWYRLAQSSSGIKKWYLNFLAKRIEQYESKALEHVDLILPITNIDQKYFQKTYSEIPSQVLPVALDLKSFQEEQLSDKIEFESNSIFHIGSLDWRPNVDAVEWLIQEVFPLVQQKNQNCQLYIAGKNTPTHLYKFTTQNIHILGEVQHAKDFMLSKNIMLVPLLSGGGMRVKIIEGMALGKVIITTSIGAEGIPCEHMKNIIIADDAKSFANAIEWTLDHPQECKNISEQAKLFASSYDLKVQAEKIKELYQL